MNPPDATPECTPSISGRSIARWWFWPVALICVWLPLLVFGLLFYRWHGNGLRIGDILLDITNDRLTQLAAGLLFVMPVACLVAVRRLRRSQPGAAGRLIALNFIVAGLSAGTVGYAGFLSFNPDASPSFMGNPWASCPNCRSFIPHLLEQYAAAHDGWYPRGGRDAMDSLAKGVDDPRFSVHIFTSHALQSALRRFWDEHHTFSSELVSYRYVEGLRWDDPGVLLYYDHPSYWADNRGKGSVFGRTIMDTSGEWSFVEESEFQKQLAATQAFLLAHSGGSRDEPSVEEALNSAKRMVDSLQPAPPTSHGSYFSDMEGPGVTVTEIGNAEWRPGAAGPTPVDPQKPYVYYHIFVGRKGVPVQPPVSAQTFRAKGVDYELLIVVASSDETYASRVRKILNDAFARWSPAPPPEADTPAKALPAVQP